jgi:ketosteroid isomerase-like protein
MDALQASIQLGGTSETDEFLKAIYDRQVHAETALHRGDVGPRLAMWSTADPVSLFGAWGPCVTGADETRRIFRWVASRFSGGIDYELEPIAAGASGDLAYLVAYERNTVSVDGGPLVANVVRATHVYRREHGEWMIVHRHGDHPPVDQSAIG